MTRTRHPTVTSERQLRLAAVSLARKCKVISRIFAQNGAPPARTFPADFSGLAKIIVGQQLSAQSAAAIWTRVERALVAVTPRAIEIRDDADLRSLGLSAAKIRTLRALAFAVRDEGLDIEELNAADETTIVERLTAIHGIGRWTADIYLLFALSRRDAFPPGDLALQLAVQHHFRLDRRPTAVELEAIAERWRPARAVAARLLWADYAAARRARLAESRRGDHGKAYKALKKREKVV